MDRHAIEEFSFMPIDYVSDNMDRLLKETFWIHKLDTLHPKGLNATVLTVSLELYSHWSVIEHRTRKQDIEPGNYTTQNLENMADLHGEI